MIPKLIEAKHLSRYKVWLKFQDGCEGEIDLEPDLWGNIFEPIKEEFVFRQFRVDPELNTLTWPNGADFSPEYLYKNISA